MSFSLNDLSKKFRLLDGDNETFFASLDAADLDRKRKTLISFFLINYGLTGTSISDADLIDKLNRNECGDLYSNIRDEDDSLRSSTNMHKLYFYMFKDEPSECFSKLSDSKAQIFTIYIMLNVLNSVLQDLLKKRLDEKLEETEDTKENEQYLILVFNIFLNLNYNSDEFCRYLSSIISTSDVADDDSELLKSKSMCAVFIGLYHLKYENQFSIEKLIYDPLLTILLKQLAFIEFENLCNKSNKVIVGRQTLKNYIQIWQLSLMNEIFLKCLPLCDLDNNALIFTKAESFNWKLYLINLYLAQDFSSNQHSQTASKEAEKDIDFRDLIRVIVKENSTEFEMQDLEFAYLFGFYYDGESKTIESLKINLAVKYLFQIYQSLDINSDKIRSHLNEVMTKTTDSCSSSWILNYLDRFDEFKNSNDYLEKKFYAFLIINHMSVTLAVDLINKSSFEVIRILYRLRFVELLKNATSYMLTQLKKIISVYANSFQQIVDYSALLDADQSYRNDKLEKFLKSYTTLIYLNTIFVELIITFSNSSLKFCKNFHVKFSSISKKHQSMPGDGGGGGGLVLHDYPIEVLISYFKDSDDGDLINFTDHFYKFKLLKEKKTSSLKGKNLCNDLYEFMNCFEEALTLVLNSLHNLSRVAYKYPKLWDNDTSHLFKSLINISTKLGKHEENYRLTAYMIIANIANESQIDSLTDTSLVLKTLVSLVDSCLIGLKYPNIPVQRTIIQGDEEEDESEVLSTNTTRISWNIIELLQALHNLSVNDKIKSEIYETHSMKDRLRLIIFNCNEMEKEYALKLMYQLCFDGKIALQIIEDKDLFGYIEKISKNEQGLFKRDGLIKNSNGILWMISNILETTGAAAAYFPTALSPRVVAAVEDVSVNNTITTAEQQLRRQSQSIDTSSAILEDILPSKKHIMISYNRESRDLCMKIKENLEKMNFKVWIDVEDIHGSSLESMAFAIEESSLVLICMTKGYKLSSNCRLEAEYTVQLNKPFVPLILQKDYKPDGWLGIILGTKMYVNFTKYDFNECMRRLKAEIQEIHSKSDKDFNKARNSKSSSQQQSKSEEKEKKKLEIVVEGTLTDTQPISSQLAGLPSSASSEWKEPKNSESSFEVKSRGLILEWSEDDVNKWLLEKNFHRAIIQNVRPSDGMLLGQIYKLYLNAPEFIYQIIQKNAAVNNISDIILLRDMAYFLNELEKLFNR